MIDAVTLAIADLFFQTFAGSFFSCLCSRVNRRTIPGFYRTLDSLIFAALQLCNLLIGQLGVFNVPAHPVQKGYVLKLKSVKRLVQHFVNLNILLLSTTILKREVIMPLVIVKVYGLYLTFFWFGCISSIIISFKSMLFDNCLPSYF